MIGIIRTSMIWQKKIADVKSPLGRIRRRAWLRMKRKKASKYRKKYSTKFLNLILSFRISPRSQSLAKEPAPPNSNTEPGVVEMELYLAPSPPPVEDILAARRAKRQAILAKYAGVASVSTSISPSPGPSSAAQPPTHSISVSNRVSVSPTSCDFALAKDSEQEEQSRPENVGEQVSAADYDPSLDRREDEYKRLGDKVTNVETIDEEVEEEEDVEDMFAVADSDKKVKKVKKIIVSSAHQ